MAEIISCKICQYISDESNYARVIIQGTRRIDDVILHSEAFVENLSKVTITILGLKDTSAAMDESIKYQCFGIIYYQCFVHHPWCEVTNVNIYYTSSRNPKR